MFGLFRPGLYVVLQKWLPHDGAKDTECVLQIVGMGPATNTAAEAK
jgi:hypothetical protein